MTTRVNPPAGICPGGFIEPEDREGAVTAAAPGIQPNEEQQARDATVGLRDTCAACGHQGSSRDPRVLAGDGYRVHLSHLLTPGDGYYGMPFMEAP